MGRELNAEFTDEEKTWLDAELGDIVDVDLGTPIGNEAGLRRTEMLGLLLDLKSTQLHAPLTRSNQGAEPPQEQPVVDEKPTAAPQRSIIRLSTGEESHEREGALAPMMKTWESDITHIQSQPPIWTLP